VSKEIHQMSRSIKTDSSAVNGPAALHPSTLRHSMALVTIAALAAFALRAEAQSPAPRAFNVRPVVGALVATGDEHDLLKNAVLVGGQASYNLNSNFAVLGSFAWSPSEDKTTTPRPKLDLYQYDLGIEGRLDDLTSGTAVATRPFASVGGGARTYNLRNVPGSSAQTNPLAFGAIGLDVGPSSGRVGVRLEARDNVTWFKGLRGELQDRNARNDVQFAAGLTFGF
jgi:outer membrane protein with beta-barrel domain